MTDSLTQIMSVIGVEIGAINTRAFLFDVVEDNYRLIASAVTPSTHTEPAFDIGDAIYEVVTRLAEVTGRVFFSHDGNLMMPSEPGGEGIDSFVITTSLVPEIRMVVFGLLNEVSLESGKRLAHSTYAKVIESIGINDRRPMQIQLDAVLGAKPDIIVFTGGTDGGAHRSMMRNAEMIVSALQILPKERRPKVLYCGNAALAEQFQTALDRYTAVYIAPNIRPSLDREFIEPAMEELSAMTMAQVYEQAGGLQRIAGLCSIPPRLSNQAFHRVIRFLGQQYDPAKGVLGIDVGASFTVASYAGIQTSRLNTFNYGLGEGMAEFMDRTNIRDITRWLSDPIEDEDARDYLWQHSLYPQDLARTPEELALELAAVRQVLRLTMRDLAARGALPSDRFEPILLSGSALSRTVTPVQSLLTILDGLQPLGICPLILDKHGILPVLGAIAEFNPLLAVQVLESSAFTNLATVVNIDSRARHGATVMSARLDYPDGKFVETEVKQGSLASLPLASGVNGLLQIKMLRRGEIEDTAIANEPVRVRGGVCGLVLDARGRPLKLSSNDEVRRQRLKEWEILLAEK
jgi:uncharacterized protein (TIGR01319 family)